VLSATCSRPPRVRRSPRRARLSSLLLLFEGDVRLGEDADEPNALDGQPPNLVAGHELERLVEVGLGLDANGFA
jgi:hypothetical protein